MKATINLISEAVEHGTDCGIDLFMRNIIKDVEKDQVFESVDPYELFEHIASTPEGEIMAESQETQEANLDEATEAELDAMLADFDDED